MTDLTALTLAQARDGLRARIFRHRTHRRASPAIESARALNAFVLETPERAREMALLGARLAKGEGGPLEGLPLGIKDLYCTDGVRTTACSHILENFIPPYKSTVTANLWRDGAVMLGKLNWTNSPWARRTRLRFGPVVSPWRRRGAEQSSCPAARPADRRRRWRRICASAPPAPNRRLDPPAGRVLRHRRTQTDLRTLLALGHRRVRIFARSGRAVHAQCPRLRHPAALNGRT